MALAEAKRITNFEGKRRQMQFIGKQMRLLSPETLQAVREALDIQRLGSAKDTQALHLAEAWRDRLIADDAAVGEWMRTTRKPTSSNCVPWCVKPARTPCR
jgi:ribosome-associated protein